MKISWVAVIGLIASGGLTSVVQALGNALPNEAKIIANIAAVVVAIAAVLYQLLQPAAKVVQDAPVVSATTGEQVGTNVSTSSTAPIVAPQKGT